MSLKKPSAVVAVLVAASFLLCGNAVAKTEKATSSEIQQLIKRLEPLEALVKEQQKTLDAQSRKIAQQEEELKNYKKKTNDTETSIMAAKAAEPRPEPKAKTASPARESGDSSGKPVVMAQESTTVQGTSIAAPPKPEQEERPEINVLPDAGGVLTPKGVLMYENSAEYTNTTSNVFSFDGVQVSQVVLVGTVNASSARRQVVQDSSRVRLGLTNRLEADVRVPYVYRNDATSTTIVGSTTTSNAAIEGHGLGDIDAGLAYQLNRGQSGWPFFVSNLRYKSDSGDGPYDVPYDANNIASRLPTGTGFQSVEGSVTMIKVTDPAVLFTNVGYVHSFGEDINKTFNTTRINDVSPGAVFNASGGMGFSINQETSFTLGYKHSYVFPTYQHATNMTNGASVESRTDSLNVGAFLFGTSYRVNSKLNLNFTAEVGATRDAPDVHLGLRVPLQVGKLY